MIKKLTKHVVLILATLFLISVIISNIPIKNLEGCFIQKQSKPYESICLKQNGTYIYTHINNDKSSIDFMLSGKWYMYTLSDKTVGITLKNFLNTKQDFDFTPVRQPWGVLFFLKLKAVMAICNIF